MTWGLFTSALLVALVVTKSILWGIRLTGRAQPGPLLRLLLFLIIHFIGLLVVDSLAVSIAAYFWSIVADLSVASVLLVSYCIVKMLFVEKRITYQHITRLTTGYIICGLCLYPALLMGSDVNLYALGFANDWLILGLGVIAFITSLSNNYRAVALWIAFSQIAWAAEIGESSNLFDYLIDPVAVLWGIGWLVTNKRLRKLMQSSSLDE